MTELEYDDAKKLIDRIWRRFTGNGESLQSVVVTRQKHFHQDPSVDPPMLEGYEGHARQVSVLRDTHVKLRARLTENEWRPQISAPKKSATLETKASDAELALVTMFSELRTNTGIDLQGGLCDGLSRDCYGVLHWYLMDAELNSEVDYEETDELPEGEEMPAPWEKQGRWTEDEYAEDSGRKKGKRYRESEESLLERRNHARAASGPAWFAEIVPATQFAFVRDKNLIGEFKYGLRVWEQPCIDWYGELDKNINLDEQAAPTDVGETGEVDTWRPSADDMEKTVIVKQLWSREYVYECYDGLPKDTPEGYKFRVVKNRQGIVPFALAPGAITLNDDPVLAYEPALTSVYRLKPAIDRYVANMGALAEASAIPRYILQPSDKALPPLTDDEGHIRFFSANAFEGMKMPEGYTLERFGGDGVSGDFQKLGDMLQAELAEAIPSTGKAEFGASTQPWTARIIQQEENIEPRMYLDHIANALLVMVRNIVKVNASEDGPGDIAFYPMDNDKKKKNVDKLIVMKPEDWQGLVCEVDINPESNTEKTAKMEFGATLVERGFWSKLDWVEKAEGEPDARRVLANREVQMYMETTVNPLLLKSAAGEWGGTRFLQVPVSKPGDPPFADMNGMAVMPQEILQANGVQPVGPPQGVGGNGMAAPQTQMVNMGQPTGGPPGMKMPGALSV